MEYIKSVKEININKENFNYYVENNFYNTKQYAKNTLEIKDDILFKLNNINSVLNKEFNELLKEDFIYIVNKEVYYNTELNGLFPDFNKFKFTYSNINQKINSKDIKLNFNGYKGNLINEKQMKVIYKLIDKDPLKGKFKGKTITYLKSNSCYWKNNNEEGVFGISSNKPSYHIPIYKLKDDKKIIVTFFKNNLLPKDLSDEVRNQYIQFMDLYHKKVIILKKEFEVDLEKLDKLIINGLEYNFDNQKTISTKTIKENVFLDTNINCNFDLIKESYLNCEKIRADIEPYDERILEDPNRGHWDLWNIEESEDNFKLTLDRNIMARNPILDIKSNGVVGIDFGTKSTVVVFQDNKENTMPMRIGMGNYSKEVNKKQYENPTVMQFICLEKFLKEYNKKIGRPNTRWEDLTISHTAKNSLINSRSEQYYSFLSDLKQWAGDSKRQLKIVDKNGFDITLKPYIELSEDDFDPIEIYAYYLGLYINNMRNGIYLDYLLSFPVTYEVSTREKIIESFKKGLKKSFPETILKNDNIMEDFCVEQGVSEPAAYAICALIEYGFDPKEDENIFYGVFDFGGGTTDFDFGLFRQAKGREQRRFDYIIEHFGASGDKFLGGENLLELLAYEVFKENEETMRKEQITFILPSECERFPGSEILVSDSQEAKLNTKQLVEELRPLWENTEKKEELISSNIISLNLFDKTGKQKPGIELLVDTEKLTRILTDRIEVGVMNFFDALKLSFKVNEEDVKNVKIFLAGNSSKSEIVNELFEYYIKNESELICQNLNCKSNKFFEIYPPLGTKEACDIQINMGRKIDENDLKRPTGKTGVAFGLVKARKGGNIKVVDKNIINNEISFKYYLGHNKRGKFRLEIDRDTEFNKWVEFIDAYEDRFEIYYTSQPKATNNDMDIKDVMRKKCKISITSEDEDVNVFIRFVSPSKIEYVVANRNEIGEEKYLSDIVVEELE